jgi:uncharacterized protein YcbX
MTSGRETTAGTVAGLWRFPVKSFQGEAATRLTITPAGVEGDRQWAVVDLATGRALSAKTVPALLEGVAVTTGEGVRLTLPGGPAVMAGGPGCDEALSAWLGRPVAIRPAGDAPTSYEMTFDPPNDDAELVDIPMPESSFVDLFAVHLLTTASLATVAAARPAGDWDIRRFRPNVVVEATGAASPRGGRPGDGGGFPEDAWVGHHLVVGGARLHVAMRTMRCALPLRAQPAAPAAGSPPLPRDVDVYRTLASLHDNDLGAYAEVAEAGQVAVGDPVQLVTGDA